MGFIAEEHAFMYDCYVIAVKGRIRESKSFSVPELLKRIRLMFDSNLSDWNNRTFISVIDAQERGWLDDEECRIARDIYNKRDRGLSRKQIGYLRVFWAKAVGGADDEESK